MVNKLPTDCPAGCLATYGRLTPDTGADGLPMGMLDEGFGVGLDVGFIRKLHVRIE